MIEHGERLDQVQGPGDLSQATAEGLRVYLDLLAADSGPAALLELRHRLTGRRMASRFYPTMKLHRLAAAIVRLGARSDVYIGCAPRTHRSGGRDAVTRAHVLWADCDGREAALRLAAFTPPPTIVISSGGAHGRHAYWALRDPLDAAGVEDANARLAQALSADAACCDPSRILRPPGTHNFKYTPPATVRLELLEPTRRYAATDVVGHLPAAPPGRRTRTKQKTPRAATSDPLLAINPDRYVLVLLGQAVSADRKVTCPFHDDAAPSLHVYPTAERGWFCFSCRRGGSIYDLAAALWGLGTRNEEFIELRARLRERLGCSIDQAVAVT